MNQIKEFLQPLCDLSFEVFVTDKVIKILYVLSIVGAGLLSLFLIVNGFANSAGTGLFMLIIGGPLVFLIGVIYARVFLEIIMVVFRISEHTTRISEHTNALSLQTQRGTPGPPPSPEEPAGPPTY